MSHVETAESVREKQNSRDQNSNWFDEMIGNNALIQRENYFEIKPVEIINEPKPAEILPPISPREIYEYDNTGYDTKYKLQVLHEDEEEDEKKEEQYQSQRKKNKKKSRKRMGKKRVALK